MMTVSGSRRTSRFATMALLAVGLTTFIVFAVAQWSFAADPPIKIGLSITETGSFSAPALFELHGYQLAAQEINAQGGLLGRQVQLVYYNDKANPATAVQLYQKLITSDHVNLLLGPYETDLVSAVEPIVNRAKMVMPGLGANVEPYDGKYPYLVQAITQTPQYMVPVIDLAAAKGYKTMALLIQETQFPEELARGIEAEAKSKGIQVVFKASYPPSTTDFSALVVKAFSHNPDMVIGATYLDDAEGIVKAAKAQGDNAKMFAFSIGPSEPQFSSGLGSAANGILGTTLWASSLPTPGNPAFVKAFQKRFGEMPDYHAAVAYSALKVLAGAVTKVGSLDQSKILAELHKDTVQTVVGPFELSKTGLQLGYKSYVLQWQSGKKQIVWPASVAQTSPQLPHTW